jgi:Tol biopolymer transport system component
MKIVRLLSWFILVGPLLYGCAAETPQNAPATSSPAVSTSPRASPPTNPSPNPQSRIGNPSLPALQVPISWSNLNLTGTLVYISSVQTQSSLIMSIQALSLTTGEITTIFQAVNGAWIDFASVSPGGKELLMAYLPPRAASAANSAGQQALYTIPLDGSQPPELLFTPPSNGDQYYQPVWSADGKYIYFAHTDFNAPLKIAGQHYPIYEIYRMAYPGGQPQKIADQAYWPRLSADGARLAFVSLDPLDGSNKLFAANADGSGAYQVTISGVYIPQIIDAPFFTPDDSSVLYSAVSPTQSSRPDWIQRLLGVTSASAHTVPSDWWSVPIGGGTPTQLTHITAVGLYASQSPDKKYIASYSGLGVFVMKMDGTNSTTLVSNLGGLSGTVSWMP